MIKLTTPDQIIAAMNSDLAHMLLVRNVDHFENRNTGGDVETIHYDVLSALLDVDFKHVYNDCPRDHKIGNECLGDYVLNRYWRQLESWGFQEDTVDLEDFANEIKDLYRKACKETGYPHPDNEKPNLLEIMKENAKNMDNEELMALADIFAGIIEASELLTRNRDDRPS